MAYRVLLLLSALRLPGCGGQGPSRSWAVSTSSQQACANLTSRQEVSARFRGKGLFVCHNKDNSDLVGICQAPYSGHDNYHFCQGHSPRPSFCPPRSLWWVRCASIHFPEPVTTTARPMFTPMFTTRSPWRPTPPTFGHTPQCGCSWSSQHGCVVSSKQLISSMTKATKGCRTGTSQECADRRKLLAVAKQFEDCPRYSVHECVRNSDICRWAAQGSGECGVKEEQLVLSLVGRENGNHPLVRLMLLSAGCNKHAEGTCEENQHCTWMPSHPQAICDVRPSIVVEMMFTHPSLVLALQRSGEEAACRTHHETGVCPMRVCQMSHGVCERNPRNAEPHSLDQMIRTICARSWKFSNTCSRPCRLTRSSLLHEECIGPQELMAAYEPQQPMPPDSWHIVKVMSLLMSLTVNNQLQCVAGNSNPEKCSAYPCEEEAPPTMVSDVLPVHSALGPGLKGVLREVSTAIASGQAGQFLGDHLENSPDATLQNLTNLALEIFSFFKPKPTPPASTTEPEPKPEAVEVAAAAVAVEDEGFAAVADFESEEGPGLNPWVIAGGAVLLAAVCSGVALGLLCHARVVRGQAREPLLANSAAEGEVPPASLASREQDMESAREGNS